MTISSETRKTDPFVGNGVITSLPFAFKVFSAADMRVVRATTATGVETDLVLTTDYTVTLNGDQDANPGGTINLNAPLAVGYTVVMTSNIGNLQPTQIANQGGFFPKVITDALDRLTILVQQVNERLSRSLSLPISASSSVNTTLPVPVAGQLIGWDNAGTGMQNYGGSSSVPVSTAIAPVVQANTLAAGRSALGASSVGDAVFTATDATAARVALGINDAAANDYKASVRFTTTGNIVLSGLGTQAGGDWGAALTAGDRVLPQLQTAGADRTIWIAAAGAWTRATDADGVGELTSGVIVAVEEGTTLADSQWMLTTDGTITIGTTPLTWARQGAVTAATGFRNKVINGGMAVDQRNAGAAQTFTAAAALAYCVDRWYGYCTGANVTGQRVAGSGVNQYRYQFTGAASVTGIGFAQRIEKINSIDLAGSTATLSVDLANSLLNTVTWTAYYANTDDTFGTLAVPTRTQIATGSFTVNGTVARYNTQIATPSAATTGIEIVFSVGAQISGTWTIGNVQFEAGSSATSFERRPITSILSDCYRYFESAQAPALTAIPRVSDGLGISAANFKSQKRATPTISGLGSFTLVSASVDAVCASIALSANTSATTGYTANAEI